MRNLTGLSALVALVSLATGCTTIPVDQRSEIREEVNKAAAETVAQLTADNPDLKAKLDGSVGYIAAQMSATKVPIVGGGYGLALLHDTERGTRTYLDISRFDLGAGLGAGKFRVLVILETREALEKFRGGTWQSAVGAESAAGSRGAAGITSFGDGYTVHIVSDTGAALTATARLIKTAINNDLTDTGVSEVSIPGRGFESIGEQGQDAPRVWDHKLPFLAQDVIDKGFDLPLPYGIGLTYANVDQAQELTNLQVGINGRPIVPFDFVTFENARSQSDTLSIKADMWLFPFMNVYAIFGKIDGQAPMDVILNGNDILDELDITCGGIPPNPNPLCLLLPDQLFTLPIEANFEGNNYGIGFTLAGGWDGWFVTLPFNWTYADMKGSNTDGASFTAAPRFGRVANLGRKGNLAVFFGGNYLDVDLTVDGTAVSPGGLLEFDFIIDQENTDKWNLLLGFNWDINKRLSWSAEYDGFIGSRDAFISSLVWRW